jgi:hypothetical protein
MLFGLFGDHYTNGTMRADKEANYNADVAKYQNYNNQ